MKIMGISGSLRAHSKTSLVLKIALEKTKNWGGIPQLIELRHLNLPFCQGEKEYENYPDVAALRKSFKTADGIILATPEYHGSISGALKNALDLLHENDMEGKVVALISVLGGEMSTNALQTMRMICRHLHAWVIPDQLAIPYSFQAFDAQGNLLDVDMEARIERLVQNFVKAIQKLR
ncbi:NADPH-dependent FMN reductase [Parachlamydia sp. AcF125]|uniref:NADPH-dependent FMN reductase n=1 Tax=Parachlamydia sp. AcF125 TaxID=2795736 RepID=UPI001BCA3FE6|nr:NADPH-dependent FMN reductase [Parachlamydia sp. AcF125]MBS4168502.1 FMN-dependent NADPH-azoreductase [Parachlamydia sp. AcF125]